MHICTHTHSPLSLSFSLSLSHTHTHTHTCTHTLSTWTLCVCADLWHFVPKYGCIRETVVILHQATSRRLHILWVGQWTTTVEGNVFSMSVGRWSYSVLVCVCMCVFTVMDYMMHDQLLWEPNDHDVTVERLHVMSLSNLLCSHLDTELDEN